MLRPLDLSLIHLESREVPAAGLFADLNPGVWGSYPQYLTASDQTLFFSAEVKVGNELWATDGTAAGTRMVKDIRPGSAGSNPKGFIAAGDGVVYFSADDGTGRTLWRSDGTATGTVKVSGVPDVILQLGGQYTPDGTLVLANGGADTVGWKGELYLVTRDLATGRMAWGKTNGRSYTELTDFDGTAAANPPVTPAMRVTGGVLELTWLDSTGGVMVWQTDGTPAGTAVRQSNLTATSPATGPVGLSAGVPITPGKYVFTSVPGDGSRASVWVGGGTSADRQLIKAFDASPYSLYIDSLVADGGKAFFRVQSNSYPRPADVGVWVTDGTPGGTRKLNATAGHPASALTTFDGKLLVEGADPTTGRSAYALTDGTATTPLPRPAGTPAGFWVYAGTAPPDAANPKGYLLFQNTGGQAYRTDGTAAGTALIDGTGLPTPPGNGPLRNWGDGRAVVLSGQTTSSEQVYGTYRGAYFRGSVYYSGKTDTQRPELWKWDLAAQGTPNPPAAAAPKVVSTTVNDGSAQRSMVKSLTVRFDAAVDVNPAGVNILNARGVSPAFAQQLTTADGVTTLTVSFPTGVGGSIADGRWTLRIDNTAVTAKASGKRMAADYAFVFTRMYGDTSGDGAYDRDTRMLVKALLGQEVGDPGYRWYLDVNSDGVIDGVDELAAVRNWGKAV